MDDFSESPSGTDEPAASKADRSDAAEPRRSGSRSPKRRFHASRYQFDLKALILLFTLFSAVFAPMSLVAPENRLAVAVTLGIFSCLVVYAFALISWIPDSALVVFLVSAPFILAAIGIVLDYWTRG